MREKTGVNEKKCVKVEEIKMVKKMEGFKNDG